jgi:endonuclease/exonuclease/phosphatase family metal-dependent hydrolase
MIACTNMPVDLNVMTFNIRYDNPEDSLNNWQYRKDIAAKVIMMNDIDILGTQEVLVNQLNDLKARLTDYQAIGVGREDGKEKGEYSAIFYKKSRFEEVESGWFWLSETPEVAGSKGWDGACERIATWAILKEKESKKKVFFINTHLDHVGKVARQEGVTLLLNRTKELSKGLPVIITGDFNSQPDSEVFKHITESGEFMDSRLIALEVSGSSGTFHAFGKIPAEKRDFIDYIFFTNEFIVNSYEVLPEKLDNTYISDHMPVMAKLLLK